MCSESPIPGKPCRGLGYDKSWSSSWNSWFFNWLNGMKLENCFSQPGYHQGFFFHRRFALQLQHCMFDCSHPYTYARSLPCVALGPRQVTQATFHAVKISFEAALRTLSLEVGMFCQANDLAVSCGCTLQPPGPHWKPQASGTPAGSYSIGIYITWKIDLHIEKVFRLNLLTPSLLKSVILFTNPSRNTLGSLPPGDGSCEFSLVYPGPSLKYMTGSNHESWNLLHENRVQIGYASKIVGNLLHAIEQPFLSFFWAGNQLCL